MTQAEALAAEVVRTWYRTVIKQGGKTGGIMQEIIEEYGGALILMLVGMGMINVMELLFAVFTGGY